MCALFSQRRVKVRNQHTSRVCTPPSRHTQFNAHLRSNYYCTCVLCVLTAKGETRCKANKSHGKMSSANAWCGVIHAAAAAAAAAWCAKALTHVHLVDVHSLHLSQVLYRAEPTKNEQHDEQKESSRRRVGTYDGSTINMPTASLIRTRSNRS